MTVVINYADEFYGDQVDEPCTLCKGPLRYPFIEWGDGKLFFCTRCCREMKNGFTADLVQAVAIDELQRSCPNFTLVREAIREDPAETAARHQKVMAVFELVKKQSNRKTET
jgi:hypothetical protein